MGDPISENVDLTMTYFEVKRSSLGNQGACCFAPSEFCVCILINVKLNTEISCLFQSAFPSPEKEGNPGHCRFLLYFDRRLTSVTPLFFINLT